MRFGLFPGCNMPAIRPDVEKAIRVSMAELGVELVDLEGYVCCPAFGTFPSCDEDGYLALSGWNMSIAEEKGLDLLIECGSCYSSLRTGRHHILASDATKARVNELLAVAGKKIEGKATPRHITDVLYHEVGLKTIRSSLKKSLDGLHAIVQYPCHTLFPSEIVGFDNPSRPHILRDLVEALGATVESYSCETMCCGGAGGFHATSAPEAEAFAKRKFEAIRAETKADLIVVSCITCLMYMDHVQVSLSKNGDTQYAYPVFDYNQLLALCMGFDPRQVACIADVPRDGVWERMTPLGTTI
jgi:heterodisulfide reductase subunit B